MTLVKCIHWRLIMSMLLWPIAAQFCTFHSMCSIASPLPPNIVLGSLTLRIKARLLCLSHKSRLACTMTCHVGPERPWGWDQTLGLINDLWAPQLHFPAATHKLEFLGLFIWPFPSDYITITNIVLLLLSSKASQDEWLLLRAWSPTTNFSTQVYLSLLLEPLWWGWQTHHHQSEHDSPLPEVCRCLANIFLSIHLIWVCQAGQWWEETEWVCDHIYGWSFLEKNTIVAVRLLWFYLWCRYSCLSSFNRMANLTWALRQFIEQQMKEAMLLGEDLQFLPVCSESLTMISVIIDYRLWTYLCFAVVFLDTSSMTHLYIAFISTQL